MSERYREHRVRTSLAPHLGKSSSDIDGVRDMARDVWREGRGVMFFPEQLDAMPWQARELIVAEAKRLYGSKRSG